MTCEQCDEMLTEPPTRRTKAEVHAVIEHIMACEQCLNKADKREIEADYIEKNILTKKQIEEIEMQASKIIEEIYQDEELCGGEAKNKQAKQARRWTE